MLWWIGNVLLLVAALVAGHAGNAAQFREAGHLGRIGEPGDPHHLRDQGLGLVDGAIEDLLGLGDQQDAIADAFGMRHHVSAEDDGRTGLIEVGDDILHHLLVRRVEPGEGLVENHKLGCMGDRGEYLYLLAHALGEGLAAIAGKLGQAIPLEQLVGPSSGGRCRHTFE